METSIVTKSNKVGREITTEKPDVLKVDTLKELVGIIGEEMAVMKIQAQLTVDFRAMIRSMLESGDIKNGNFTYSDDEILSNDFSGWKPEKRIRKSAEQKAAELIKDLSPEQLKVAMELANKSQ